MDEKSDNKVKLLKVFLIILFLGITLISIYLKSIGTNLVNVILDYTAKNLGTEVTATIDFDVGSRSNFAVLKNSYVQCTKDGVKYFGDSQWNETYTMTSPIIISEGNIIAVGEFKNKIIYVFNEKGKMYSIQTEFPIEQFSINKLGYLVVIMKDTNMYKISLYDSSGTWILSRDEEEQHVYPMSADISNDGKSMAVSYLDTSASAIKYTSKILFFSVDNDEDYIDNIKGNIDGTLNVFNAAIEKKEEIMFNISYMDNNVLIATTNQSITAINDKSEEIWVEKLNNELTALDISDGKTIVIGLGKELPGGSDYTSGTAVWYDLTGRELGKFETGKKIEFLTCKSNRILVYSGKKIYGLNRTGSLIWEHITLQDVENMFIFDNTSNIFVVYKNSAQLIYTKSRNDNKDEEDTSSQNKENSTENLESSEPKDIESSEVKNEDDGTTESSIDETIPSQDTTDNTESTINEN